MDDDRGPGEVDVEVVLDEELDLPQAASTAPRVTKAPASEMARGLPRETDADGEGRHGTFAG